MKALLLAVIVGDGSKLVSSVSVHTMRWLHSSIVTGSLLAVLLVGLGLAGEPANRILRRIPPEGIEIASADHDKLLAAVAALTKRLEEARHSSRAAEIEPLLPDVEIFLKAARYALELHEFYDPKDVQHAYELLQMADGRLDQLLAAGAPWATERGLVVRGFRSQIDDSVQPYGLVIPRDLDLQKPCPLYVWLHGRGDRMTDLDFLYRRLTQVGSAQPVGAIVLHPFGRYSNAFKFAGEYDVFEAIDAVARNYAIDRDRIVLWGFSMGGAGAWHLGAHYPDRWAAMSAGAGFAETARYQNLKPEDVTWYERTLWNLYDVPSYTRNLFNLPVVAYSGENDRQIQAARVMEEAYTANGRTLHHLIGPGMGHQFHPDSLAELHSLLAGYAAQRRNRFPSTVHLQTRTLRYNRAFWVELLALEEHWRDTRVDAALTGPSAIELTTKNVEAMRLNRPWSSEEPYQNDVSLEIDGQSVSVPPGRMPGGVITLENVDGKWLAQSQFLPGSAFRKLHGLQGPIDDVFFEPFLVVVPSGACANPKVDAWVKEELAHFRDRWRRLFRGELRVKRDTDVTYEDMQQYHLVLWGDRKANVLIDRIAEFLPFGWDQSSLRVGTKTYDATHHVLACVYPNPLQQRAVRSIVINSGMTFRENHDRTNSLQIPKLPDWAIIDLSEPPDGDRPGKVVDAGFFDEHWQLQPPRSSR